MSVETFSPAPTSAELESVDAANTYMREYGATLVEKQQVLNDKLAPAIDADPNGHVQAAIDAHAEVFEAAAAGTADFPVKVQEFDRAASEVLYTQSKETTGLEAGDLQYTLAAAGNVQAKLETNHAEAAEHYQDNAAAFQTLGHELAEQAGITIDTSEFDAKQQ